VLKSQNAESSVDAIRNLLLSATGSFKTAYHLEFFAPDVVSAHYLCERLAVHNIFANITNNRVYIKDSESICNLLAYVGAVESLCELNNQIAMRECKNVSNRRANCDSANIKKSVETAQKQIQLFKQIKQGEKFETLDAELRALIETRLENPTATYDELGEILGLTKSAVVRRIKKLS